MSGSDLDSNPRVIFNSTFTCGLVAFADVVYQWGVIMRRYRCAALAAVAVVGLTSLPVKAAEPVQYVKICSLYGAGFYYIPGTDMCLKVGGYVRAQAEWQSNNGLAFGSTNAPWGPNTIDDGRFNRTTNSLYYTGRAMISADARNQSEYGTIRSYIRLGWQPLSNTSTAANTFTFDRAFIQFAGFTAGTTQSYFGIFSNTELFSYIDAKTSGDTYNRGIPTFAYTAQFGSGVSATLAVEIPRYQAGVGDGSTNVFAVNGVTNLDTAGFNMPDIIGNLRIDQNWGYFGVSGAIHRVAGRYYGTTVTSHPDDKYGWAAQVGGLINLPWGDTFGASFVGTKGAIGYATKAGSWQIYNGNSAGVGWVTDGLFDNLTGQTPIHLTNAWSANAGYEHRWNQRWRTSLYGGYTKIWYDDAAINLINAHLPGAAGTTPCGVPVAGSVWPPVNVPAGGGGNSCSPNFSFWQVGSRTQWNIDSSLYMGLDVFYTRLNTAYKGTSPGLYPAVDTLDDQGVWSAIFRVQHNFVP